MLLDTNLISHYIAPHARERYPWVVDFIDRAIEFEEIHVAYVTVYELRRGLAKIALQSPDRRREARKKRVALDQLLGVMPRLGLDPGGWDVAADLWAKGQVHKPAVNFAEQDLLIAATALWHELPLATAETKNAMAAWLPNLAPRLQLRVVRPES